MTLSPHDHLPRLILCLALLATVAVYWAGLAGPFMLDDQRTLIHLHEWQNGQTSWQSAIFPNSSILLSRPVAMASFMLNMTLLGPDSFSFKLGNLLVHLACGVLCWAVLRRVLARDTRLAAHAEWLAALVATLWLLHPLHVSTVLYAVQRMAQLAALFTLAAVWVYLLARQQLSEGRTRAAWFNLFVSFPVLLVLGVLSKQNAAVAPVLCLLLEWVYYRPQTRPGRTVPVFFVVFVGLPALGLATLLLRAPHTLLATYADWDFTLAQRLLTQPRALMDYLGMLLWPRGPQMGLYTDDFIVSTGLLSPPSTLLALLALGGLSVGATVLRSRAPSVCAGWWFFLLAHAVESSFLPLEMYYEHRNYLPALGLLLALVGLLALVPAFKTNTLSPRKLGLLAVTGLALMLGVATLGRVLIWQDMAGITQQALRHHPDSLRLRFDLLFEANRQGDLNTAMVQMQALTNSADPRNRQIGHLGIFTLKCIRKDRHPGTLDLQRAVAEDLPRLNTYTIQVFYLLIVYSRNGGCGDVSANVIADYLARIVQQASIQSENSEAKWYARRELAGLYAYGNNWPAARTHAALAWQGSAHDPASGLLLVLALHNTGDTAKARQVLAQLEAAPPTDPKGLASLARIRQQLASPR